MDQYLAEIRVFANNYPPQGWAACNGQILAISSNTALFSLLGTYYGGNGTTTFGLPDFQGRVAYSAGQGPGTSQYPLGTVTGTETVTLLAGQIATHTHNVNCSSDGGDNPSPGGTILAACGADRGAVEYAAPGGLAQMNPGAVSPNGNNQPHNNMSPYLGLNICIALQGNYPPRS